MEEQKKKKRETFLCSPARMTELLKDLGETYDKRETSIYYVAFIIAAIVLGLLFELKPILMLIVLIVFVLCVPQIIYNQKKHRYEENRFNDVNVYMSHFAQSFVRTGNIKDSLEEIEHSFTAGRMKDVLNEALEIVKNGQADIVNAEIEALNHIESKYGCEKLMNLHAFILSVVEKGGRCDAEFVILEKIRLAWKEAVTDYHDKLLKDRRNGVMLYGLLLLVGVMLLNRLAASDVDITNILLTQITNTVLLSIYVLYYVAMDKRLNRSLLRDAKYLSKESADYYFSYIKNFDSKKERKKYIVFGILSIIIAVSLYIYAPTFMSVGIGICIILAGFNVHKFIFVYTMRGMKKEIRRAFPKWLFDVMLLLQRESVEGAIILSIDKAPPVLQTELIRITNAFSAVPEEGKDFELHNADAYTSFFADFRLPEVEETMSKLYSLAVGISGDSGIMNVMMEANLKLLNKSERDSMEVKNAIEVYSVLPVLVVSFGFIMYMVSTLVVAVGNIYEMF